ncbi:MAG: class I SAM-dependent methyltransferase [Caulobacteraceae bacterium]|nr:class I SAM-dependent methyltransferase [Caulobacteraceae bacterium]
MILRGIGQSDDSPVTGTAAWLSSVCAILDKDPFYGPLLNDPYARHFAEAFSPESPVLLARYDDRATREAFIQTHEAVLCGSVTMPSYRKPLMEALARESLLQTGAKQLVVMGAGCDTLCCRLARAGFTPVTFEIDRPPVSEFRSRVLAQAPLDLSHVRELGVDFDHQTFGEALLGAGYDPALTTIFFAEGLLGYLQPEAVDEIFKFVRLRAGAGSRFVFSFTEGRSKAHGVRAPNSEVLDRQGEPPVFDLPFAEAKAYIEARGLKVRTLRSAKELYRDYSSRYAGRIGVVPYMHFAVAES